MSRTTRRLAVIAVLLCNPVGAAVSRASERDGEILIWAPVVAGDRVILHLRDGSELVRILAAGDDSVLVFAKPRQKTDVFAHEAGPDTLARASVLYLERRDPPDHTAPLATGVFGALIGGFFGVGLALFFASMSGD